MRSTAPRRAAVSAAILAVTTLVACGPDQSSSSVPFSDKSAQRQAGDQSSAADHSVPYEVSITQIERRDKVGTRIIHEGASEGGILIVVQYALKNVSKETIPASGKPSIQLVDGAGNRHSPDISKTAAFAAEGNADARVLSDLNPGVTEHDAEVFDIAQAAFDPGKWKIAVDGQKDMISLDTVNTPQTWWINFYSYPHPTGKSDADGRKLEQELTDTLGKCGIKFEKFEFKVSKRPDISSETTLATGPFMSQKDAQAEAGHIAGLCGDLTALMNGPNYVGILKGYLGGKLIPDMPANFPQNIPDNGNDSAALAHPAESQP